MCKISIIIPVYNVEQYIRQCLESVFNQDVSLDDYEVIIVNDGTKDNSMNIVNEFANKYSNLKIINQENQGQSGARNSGLRIAQGEYVWFIDSDDWIEQGVIKQFVKVLNNCSPELLAFDAIFIYSNSANNRKTVSNLKMGIPYTGFKFMKITPLYSVWTFLYCRNFLNNKKIRFKEGLLHEEGDFNIKALAFAQTIIYFSVFAYNYRAERTASTMNTVSLKRLTSSLRLVELNNQFIRENNFGKRNNSIIMKHRWKAVHGVSLFSKDLNTVEKNKFLKDLTSYKKDLCYCLYNTANLFYILQIPFVFFFPITFFNIRLFVSKIYHKWK